MQSLGTFQSRKRQIKLFPQIFYFFLPLFPFLIPPFPPYLPLFLLSFFNPKEIQVEDIKQILSYSL